MSYPHPLRHPLLAALLLTATCLAPLHAADADKAEKKGKAPKAAKATTVGPVVGENKATPVSRIKAAKDFRVELIYTVPGKSVV